MEMGITYGLEKVFPPILICGPTTIPKEFCKTKT